MLLWHLKCIIRLLHRAFAPAKHSLVQMHTAAIGDTLGIAFSMVGLMIFSGLNFTTLKMGMIVLFLWLSSPVSSHLIARLEITTDEKIDEYCEVEKDDNI